MTPNRIDDEDLEAQRFFSGDTSDLLGLIYTNGLSDFEVLARDASNPSTHVVSRHTSTGVSFTVSAATVRRHLDAFGWGAPPRRACEAAA